MEAVTHAVRWIASRRDSRTTHAVVLRDLKSLFTFTFTYLLTAGGRWGTTDDFATSFLHFPLFSAALWDLAKSRPEHSPLLSSLLFLCLLCLLHPLTVLCKIVLARSDEQETRPYHFNLRLFMMVRRSSCGPIACWILARTSSLVP